MLVDMIPTLIACVLYLVTALLIWRRPHRVLEQILPPVALALHGTALSVFVFRAGTITLGFNEALSLFAWQSSFLLWALCFREPLRILGTAVYQLTALAAIVAIAWPSPPTAIIIDNWKAPLPTTHSLFFPGRRAL